MTAPPAQSGPRDLQRNAVLVRLDIEGPSASVPPRAPRALVPTEPGATLRLLTRTPVRVFLAALALTVLAFAGGVAAASVSSGRGGSERRAAAERATVEPKVAIYGDSLTLQASPYLTAI